MYYDLGRRTDLAQAAWSGDASEEAPVGRYEADRGRRPVRRRLPVSLAAATLCLSCLDLTWTFRVDEAVDATTVPAGTPLSSQEATIILDQQLNIQSESEYQEEEFDYIERIAVTGLTFRIATGSPSPDFSFLTSFELYLMADLDGDSTPERVLVAYQDDPAAFAGSEVTLVATGADIKDYVAAAGGYRITLEATGSPPSEDAIFEGVVAYEVEVGLWSLACR